MKRRQDYVDIDKTNIEERIFVDKDSAPLKDEAKIKADLVQEKNNVVLREEFCAHCKKLEQMTDDTQKAHALTVNNHCGKVM